MQKPVGERQPVSIYAPSTKLENKFQTRSPSPTCGGFLAMIEVEKLKPAAGSVNELIKK